MHEKENSPMSKDDVQASHYDIGTTSIRLVRVGNVIQVLFQSAHLKPNISIMNWRKSINKQKTN